MEYWSAFYFHKTQINRMMILWLKGCIVEKYIFRTDEWFLLIQMIRIYFNSILSFWNNPIIGQNKQRNLLQL